MEFGNYTDTLEYTDLICVDRDECEDRLTDVENYMDSQPFCTNGCWEGYTLPPGYSYNSDFPDLEQTGNASLDDSQICAIGDNTDSCQGDSGGPLIQTGSNTQVGITSWGWGCNIAAPGVYTNVYEFKEWILEEMSKVK